MPMFSTGMMKTAGRYVMTAVGSGIAVLGALNLISQTDATAATTAITSIAESLGTIATAVATLTGIGATIYAGIRGTANASPANVAASAAALKNDPESPVKGVILEPTPAGHELASEILSANPEAGVAPAGTGAALSIATPTPGETK